MCGNILPCFSPLDDRDVFYSVDKCFENEADPHNIFDKQIKKEMDAMFVGVLLRDFARDFGVEFESSRHDEIFESARARHKTVRTLKPFW